MLYEHISLQDRLPYLAVYKIWAYTINTLYQLNLEEDPYAQHN